jgi:hypothetical protein
MARHTTKKTGVETPPKRLEPEEVLQYQLEYLHERCLKDAQAITIKLKNDSASGAELARHYDNIVKAREQLIKVSATLIPYRKPRLESIEVKSETEHRFVVVSPTPIKSHEEFLTAIAAPNKQPLIVGSGAKPLNILDISSPEPKISDDIFKFLPPEPEVRENIDDKRRMYLED